MSVSSSGVRGSAVETRMLMCMLCGPVRMMRACTSTRSPMRTGARKWMPPEYTPIAWSASGWAPIQPTAHA